MERRARERAGEYNVEQSARLTPSTLPTDKALFLEGGSHITKYGFQVGVGQTDIAAPRWHGHGRAWTLKSIDHVAQQLCIIFAQWAFRLGEVRSARKGTLAVAAMACDTGANLFVHLVLYWFIPQSSGRGRQVCPI